MCLDAVIAAARSKKFSARQKGVIRCLACQGLWPLSRAREAGYDVGDVRSLCNAPWGHAVPQALGMPGCRRSSRRYRASALPGQRS
eukprot:7469996-Pyramimonas_sp.AAC.1